MTDFNPYQRVVADTYGGGDYAHLTKLSECRDVGDTLFTFLMIELSTKEGTDSPDEALRRMTTARLQLQDVERALFARKPASEETPA